MASKDAAPQVTFWGAAGVVTGSMHLVQANGLNLLLDCGLYQGRRAEAFQRNRNFPFQPSNVHAVLLSHAHIDHCGNLPNLFRHGFGGPIFCTPATHDLLAVMLADSAKIQEEDAAYLNRQADRQGPRVEPLYTRRDAARVMRLAQPVGYDRVFELGKGLAFTFVDAGHLLGSAMVHLTIERDGRGQSLTFTGDVGRKGLPILRDPAPIPPADLVISESTYGGRIHPPVDILADTLGQVVERTVRRGGKVLVPAFSLGRTQAVLYFLHQLFSAGRLKDVPIFVDSPLAASATAVFQAHPECFDEETSLLLGEAPDLFGERRVHFVRDVEESKRLNALKDPCLIIAASGMCESGRIQHHLKQGIEDERNTILIIGYQAPETLGRRIVERRPEIRIHDRYWKLRAEVVVLNGFSSHADRNELLELFAPLASGNPTVRLVHGDPDQSQALAEALRGAGFKDVAIPGRGDTVALRAPA
ncbi:MAG: MBL fold metallo-hydrolase [Gemmataceae bacterium]